MSARTIQVCFATQAGAFVRGFGSRELLIDIRGRAPVYNTRLRAWAAMPSTASDLIAVAERRGWTVEVVSEAHLVRLAGGEAAEERQQLW